MAAVYGAFFGILRSQKGYYRIMAQEEEQAAVRRIMEADLRGLMVLPFPSLVGILDTLAGQEFSQMDFVTSRDPFAGLEEEVAPGDICEVGYRLVQDRDEESHERFVLLRRQDSRAVAPLNEGGREIILSRDILIFDVFYLQPEDVSGQNTGLGTGSNSAHFPPGDASRWHKEWQEEGLPEAVCVGIVFAGSDEEAEDFVQDKSMEIDYDVRLVVPVSVTGPYPKRETSDSASE